VIVANILAKPLIELSPYFSKKLKDDGLICVSGILAHQTDAIKRAYESVANFSICHQKEDWVMLAGMKLCI
jgi:ribosomal protein L11 methyltransferase